MNPIDMRRGYRALRQHADSADKEQLIARLRQEAAVTVPRLTRVRDWFESFRRFELAGFASATALAVLMAVGVPMYRNAGDFGPQVEEMDYDGGSTMVIEDKKEHTTLIWLSDAEETAQNEDDPEDEAPLTKTPTEKI